MGVQAQKSTRELGIPSSTLSQVLVHRPAGCCLGAGYVAESGLELLILFRGAGILPRADYRGKPTVTSESSISWNRVFVAFRSSCWLTLSYLNTTRTKMSFSTGKSTCHTSWRPEFHPWEPGKYWMQGHTCKHNILRRWERRGGQERDRGKGGEEERRRGREGSRQVEWQGTVSQTCNPSTQEA